MSEPNKPSSDTKTGTKPPIIVGLDAQDRLKLLQLAADVKVREQELALAAVRLETAKLVADAFGNAITAKMSVPDAAKNVRIDNNAGLLIYEMPE